MMLFDGCFIVEVIRKFGLPHLRGDYDPIFKQGWMLPHKARDMILHCPRCLIFLGKKTFLKQFCFFYNGILREKGCRRDDVYQYPIKEIKHLLHLIHDIWLPSPAGVEADELHNHTVDCVQGFFCSATEIQKAGIQFLKIRDDSLFDIKFENPVMRIPSLKIDDATETIFQNLIAYEQCSHDINLKHVRYYIEFLKCLINSSKDAELLCCRGIIVNFLGDDEVIAALFNKLCDGVVFSERFYYCRVCNEVNSYCNRPRNRWMAELRRRHEKLGGLVEAQLFQHSMGNHLRSCCRCPTSPNVAASSVCSYFLLSTSAKSLKSRCNDCGIGDVYQDGCRMSGNILTPKEFKFINRN